MGKTENTACFTGHRPHDLPFAEDMSDGKFREYVRQLRDVILTLLETSDINNYVSGVAWGIDMIAAETVLELRDEGYPLTLEAAVPYLGQERSWGDGYKTRYANILSRADKVTVLSDYYYQGCLPARNRYMISSSAVCIATWTGKETGGTAMTVSMAREAGRKVVIIDPSVPRILSKAEARAFPDTPADTENQNGDIAFLGKLRGRIY